MHPACTPSALPLLLAPPHLRPGRIISYTINPFTAHMLRPFDEPAPGLGPRAATMPPRPGAGGRNGLGLGLGLGLSSLRPEDGRDGAEAAVGGGGAGAAAAAAAKGARQAARELGAAAGQLGEAAGQLASDLAGRAVELNAALVSAVIPSPKMLTAIVAHQVGRAGCCARVYTCVCVCARVRMCLGAGRTRGVWREQGHRGCEQMSGPDDALLF